MNHNEIQCHLRAKLINRCMKKLKRLREQALTSLSSKSSTPKSGDHKEITDRANSEIFLTNSQFFRERIRKNLNEIEAALKRIEEGTYGVCEISGHLIEDNRLLAVPWTRVSFSALNDEAI